MYVFLCAFFFFFNQPTLGVTLMRVLKVGFNIFAVCYIKIKLCFAENSAVFVILYWKTFLFFFCSFKCDHANNLTFFLFFYFLAH